MGRRFRHVLLSGLFLLALNLCFIAHAQEFKCSVEIDTRSVEGTYKHIFEELENEMESYVNEHKWTDFQFAVNEKIECRFFLTVKGYSAGKVNGDLQIQLSRPVFNSSYKTNLLNYKDSDVEFKFQEGDRLTHTENTWDGNLKGLLDFYCLLMLAIDADSFSLYGGQEFYDRVDKVVQLAQSVGEKGWRQSDDNRNRSSLISAFTEKNTSSVRDFIYTYHRKGLDQMSASVAKGRNEIVQTLNVIWEISKVSPHSFALSWFRDSKLEEFLDIFSKSPKNERKTVYDVLKSLFPMDADRLESLIIDE